MASIKLTRGKYALVDDEDFEFLSQWKWTFDATTGYAYRRQHLPSSRKHQKCRKVYMHRLINQTPEGMLTDHINRDRLDNQRSNLRTVTKSQSQFNRNKPTNNSSGYKGISWSKRDKIWVVNLQLNRVRVFRGYFKDLDKAIKARQEAEKSLALE